MWRWSGVCISVYKFRLKKKQLDNLTDALLSKTTRCPESSVNVHEGLMTHPAASLIIRQNVITGLQRAVGCLQQLVICVQATFTPFNTLTCSFRMELRVR